MKSACLTAKIGAVTVDSNNFRHFFAHFRLFEAAASPHGPFAYESSHFTECKSGAEPEYQSIGLDVVVRAVVCVTPPRLIIGRDRFFAGTVPTIPFCRSPPVYSSVWNQNFEEKPSIHTEPTNSLSRVELAVYSLRGRAVISHIFADSARFQHLLTASCKNPISGRILTG